MKKKIKIRIAAPLLLIGMLSIGVPLTASAQSGDGNNGRNNVNNMTSEFEPGENQLPEDSNQPAAQQAQAGGGNSPGGGNGNLFGASKDEACKGANLSNNPTCADGANKVQGVLERIINLLSVIVGIAAVVVIIINGLRFITANGDSNSINSARNGIIYAAIGLILVALAQAIVRFVLSKT